MKRIIIFLLLLFSMINMVSAVTNDSETYYSHDADDTVGTLSIDSAFGVQQNGTLQNSPTTTVPGILNNSYEFDGVNQYVNTSVIPTGLNAWSFSMWVNHNDTPGSDEAIFGSLTGGGDADKTNLGIQVLTTNQIRLLTRNSVNNQVLIASAGAMTKDTWHHIVGTFDGVNIRLFIDNVNNGTAAQTGTFNIQYKFAIGAFQNGASVIQYFDGRIDEWNFYNRNLSLTEISELYNGGLGFNPFAPVVNAPQIISDLQNYYNSSNITVNLTTSPVENTNMSYSLDGAAEVSICNDCNTSLLNLTGLSDALHNITWVSTNINGQTNNSKSFTVDTTNPSLTVNLPNNFTFYTGFNFSQYITVSDTNLVSCVVSISNEPATTCTEENYNFTFNGNHTINVTATDIVNRTNSSLNNLMLINPQQFFYFVNNGTPITNFSFGGVNFTDFAAFSTYEDILVLGNNSLLFEKLGFATTNVTFVINTTSALNLTTNITQSQINVRIFNRETEALLTGLTDITLQATTGFIGSTTTGLLNITNINFINEQYQILAEHTGFESETVYFDYTNQETITVDIFMLNTSAPELGTIQIVVKNSLSQFVESAICSALEWRANESAFVSVAQGLTNVNGETLLNIELNTKIYKFSCTKDTFTIITNAQIVQVDASSLTIILDDVILEPTPLFENLVTSLTNTTINATHQLITYTFADADGLTTEACLQSFFINGNRRTFDQESCVSTATGSILLTVNINQSSSILLQGILSTDAVSDYVTDSLLFKGIGDIAFQFKIVGIDVLVPTVFIVLGLALGLILFNANLAVILMAIAGWISVAFVPTVISGSIAMFITVIVGLILYGGFSRK